MHDLMKKKKTPQKRNARSKKEERRKTWREHLFDIVLGLAVAAMFIVLSWLGRRTISNIPVSALWGCVLATLFFVLVWAAFRKNLDKGTFLIYLFVGFLGGIFLFIFLGTVFLGTNYLFPRSDPYQRKAVVYGKKETHRSRGFTSYYIKLGFYDGRRYAWDGGYKEYDRFQQGDTCDVTLYKGLWGFEVIKDVKVIGSVKHPPCPRAVFTSLLLRRVEVKPGMLNTNILHALSRDAHNGRYGVPVSVRQVTGCDMGGEFRIGLLNHATFEEIDSGKRVFVECTWNLGKKDENDERRLTCWYEWHENYLHPVDSILWSTDEEF